MLFNIDLITGTAPPKEGFNATMCSELVFESMNFGTSTLLGLFWDFNSFKKMGTDESMKSLGFVNFHQQCEFGRATCWFNPWIVGMPWAQRCFPTTATIRGSDHLPQSPGHFWRRLNLSLRSPFRTCCKDVQNLFQLQQTQKQEKNNILLKISENGTSITLYYYIFRGVLRGYYTELHQFLSRKRLGRPRAHIGQPSPRQKRSLNRRWVNKTRGHFLDIRLAGWTNLRKLRFVTWNSNHLSIPK